MVGKIGRVNRPFFGRLHAWEERFVFSDGNVMFQSSMEKLDDITAILQGLN